MNSRQILRHFVILSAKEYGIREPDFLFFKDTLKINKMLEFKSKDTKFDTLLFGIQRDKQNEIFDCPCPMNTCVCYNVCYIFLCKS